MDVLIPIVTIQGSSSLEPTLSTQSHLTITNQDHYLLSIIAIPTPILWVGGLAVDHMHAGELVLNWSIASEDLDP